MASIRRWSDSGLLPASRVGRRRERRFAQADLVRFLGEPRRDLQAAVGAPSSSVVTVGGVRVPLKSHLAPIYASDAGALRLSVPFLADGLKAGQPCFLVATGEVLKRYLSALGQFEGVDVAASIQNGQLTVLPAPGVNPQDAIGNIERLFGKALESGPMLLRLVGEMACVRHAFASDAEMMTFEEAYDVMSRRFPAIALCQYDAREFNGEVVLRALKAHPDMFERLGGFLN